MANNGVALGKSFNFNIGIYPSTSVESFHNLHVHNIKIVVYWNSKVEFCQFWAQYSSDSTHLTNVVGYPVFVLLSGSMLKYILIVTCIYSMYHFLIRWNDTLSTPALLITSSFFTLSIHGIRIPKAFILLIERDASSIFGAVVQNTEF